MMLLGVFSLHFSTLISAESIFSPMVQGSDDTQLVLWWLVCVGKQVRTHVGWLPTHVKNQQGTRPGTVLTPQWVNL